MFLIGLDELVEAKQTLFERVLHMCFTRVTTYFGIVFHQKLPHNLEDLRPYLESPFMIVHICRLTGGKIEGI
ncbi:hypothetical protein CXB36_17990 [Pseudomonas syringae pv. syringae]|nr:hypothetical protein BKC06_014740 [Pseudomonas syringae pv. syringae]KTB91258.1 hypothetical protein AO072_20920 [Pseudomonas syringae ICMP 13102]KTB93911.1 hypothetical protein AO069_04875 [Pseudomonas syringae pv. syringae PD2774]PBP74114.1 hypothetical protein CCL21_01625 [Pseudomonas syringae]KWS11854.1 hypothetical protein AL063_16120 [Pseudomonas syringae pv. syringae]